MDLLPKIENAATVSNNKKALKGKSDLVPPSQMRRNYLRQNLETGDDGSRSSIGNLAGFPKLKSQTGNRRVDSALSLI